MTVTKHKTPVKLHTLMPCHIFLSHSNENIVKSREIQQLVPKEPMHMKEMTGQQTSSNISSHWQAQAHNAHRTSRTSTTCVD